LQDERAFNVFAAASAACHDARQRKQKRKQKNVSRLCHFLHVTPLLATATLANAGANVRLQRIFLPWIVQIDDARPPRGNGIRATTSKRGARVGVTRCCVVRPKRAKHAKHREPITGSTSCSVLLGCLLRSLQSSLQLGRFGFQSRLRTQQPQRANPKQNKT
jgi:hypothetical protein